MRTHSLALLLALAAALAPSAPAQSRRPMTFEDMMAMKRLGETAVSPDGRWLAYSVTTVQLEKNRKTAELFLQPVAEKAEPQKISVAQPGDSGLQFAADGHRILFLSARTGSQQLYVADFDAATGATSHERKLTELAGEADSALWSPDGQSIVFTSQVYPDCPVLTPADAATGNACNQRRDAEADANPVKAQIFTHLLYRHWNHFTGDKRSHLFLLSLKSGELRDLNPNNPHDLPPFTLEGGCGCAFAPDSKELAFTENLDPEPATSVSARIFTLDLTNPAAKPVQVSTSRGGNFNPAYSPDGKYLAFRSEDRPGYESEQFRLFLYDRATKTAKNLLPKFDRWIDEFAWKSSNTLYFVSGNHGASTLFSLSIQDGSVTRLKRMESSYTSSSKDATYIDSNGEFSDLHTIIMPSDPALAASMPNLSAITIIATKMKVNQPAEVVRILVSDLTVNVPQNSQDDIQSLPVTHLQIQPLTHLNDALLAQLDLAPLQDYWFTAADGTKLQGFVLRPPAFDAAKKYPTKLLIHGGPQGAWGDAWSYRWNAELFAANGYAVVMINPRGSTGYGQTITDGVNGDWGGKPFRDLMLGMDAAEKQFDFIDKTRECALGASYGGYMANWVLGHTTRFRCIVSHDGMFNPESAYGTTEELWFNEWEFKGKPWDYYGKPDSENPYRKWAPAQYAKNFKTPTLVIHGQLDYRLDVAEGYQLFTTLQRLGVPSKMLYFPDEGHWVLKPQNSRLWYKTVNDWVDQWTAPAK